MGRIRTIGLPTMHKERGEKRVFLPSFLEKLAGIDVDVLIEEGYGESLGFSQKEYQQANRRVRVVSREEVYEQEFVVVLRAPDDEDLGRMKSGAILLSMLHYETRPRLVEMLQKSGIKCYSLDSIVDDTGSRLVVTYEITAGAGVREAFREMAQRRPDFLSPARGPIRVTILGMGHLGVQAGRASFALGEESLSSRVIASGAKGCVVTYLEREITGHAEAVNCILRSTDLLIDATKRLDPTKYIIRNEQLQWLPAQALILDLTADPYDVRTSPVQIKAIEGIPGGTLDQYVFDTDDPAWDAIPPQVNSLNRRVVLSCNAWPGIMPFECMRVYEHQLLPLISRICSKDRIQESSPDPLERALHRASLEHYISNHE